MTSPQTLEYLGAHVGGLLDPVVFAALRSVITRRRSLVFIEELPAR